MNAEQKLLGARDSALPQGVGLLSPSSGHQQPWTPPGAQTSAAHQPSRSYLKTQSNSCQLSDCCCSLRNLVAYLSTWYGFLDSWLCLSCGLFCPGNPVLHPVEWVRGRVFRVFPPFASQPWRNPAFIFCGDLPPLECVFSFVCLWSVVGCYCSIFSFAYPLCERFLL